MMFDGVTARGFVCAVVVMTILLCGSASYAQLAGANLSGSVKDESGASVPNAQISIREIETDARREIQSNSEGLYSAPNLTPGTYEVTVTAQGFTSLVLKNLTLTVGSERTLDITLKVGQLSQKIEVNSSLPNVETASSTVGATVEQKMIVELPLNGRDWTLLATLQPGVTALRAQAQTGSNGSNRGNRGFGNQLSDSGHRPYENTYRVDGININDYSNGAPGSVLGIALGVDAIQEFNVVTTNYSAEYGRTSGAVINSITKSGTNEFHGSAYFFDRDKIFDARNFFDPPAIPPFRRIQFGASGGDAIIKDKTFIFGDYEGIRESESGTFSDIVPSAAARQGHLVSGDVAVDPNIQPFLALWPLPNAGSNGDTGTFNVGALKTVRENYFTLKLDQKMSASDNLNATYFFDSAPQTIPDALNNLLNQLFTRRQMFAITETHIFSSSLVNTSRLGFNRTRGLVNQPYKALNPAAASTSLGIFPGQTTSALLNVNGITPAFGLGGAIGFVHVLNSFQAYDDLFWSRGKHSLKFGFAFERIQANELSSLRINGTAGFSSLANFLTNKLTSVVFYDPKTRKELGARESLFGGYAQDDWRVRSNLTLNLGLRYEMLTLPTEVHGGFGSLSNFFGGTFQLNRTFWQSNPTLHNFDPRIGFSWDPFHQGKTAVRAGFGIFDVLPLPYGYASEAVLTPPFSFALSSSDRVKLAGQFPHGIVNLVTFNPGNTRYMFAEPHPKRSYSMVWNMNIQQEINHHTSAMIGYVGSHTVHQTFSGDDSNMVIPSRVDGTLVWPGPTACNGGPCPVANPNVGSILPIFYDNSTKYNGLQTQLLVKDLHGFQSQVSYTWSKCLDAGSGAGIADPFVNSIATLMFFDKAGRNGPCDFDIRHNLSVNYIYSFPSPKPGSLISWIGGGWQVGGIISVSTGVPFTLAQGGDPGGGDPLGEGNTDPFDFPNRIPNCNPYNSDFKHNGMAYINANCFSYPSVSLNSPIAPLCNNIGADGNPVPDTNGQRLCLNIFGNNGRNQLFGPKLVNSDFSLIKNTHISRISELFNVQFRFEVFNIFNHANFQAPVDNLAFNGLVGFNGVDPGSAGVIDSTTTPARQIQLGLKIVW
jgi:hypothetical protein